MAKPSETISSASGKITAGLSRGTLLRMTIAFIAAELPSWRDRPDRRDEIAEERLNAQLCKHLNSRARHKLPMVLFHHEEKQTADRRIDISAGLSESGFIGTTYHSIDDPFIALEGKRFPTPGGKKRQREYVSGGAAKTGGIQRFKLGLHGAHFDRVLMIGYIQKGTLKQWYERVNAWIVELAASLAYGEETWEFSERLDQFSQNVDVRTATSTSTHSRATFCVSNKIVIDHIWIEMKRNQASM